MRFGSGIIFDRLRGHYNFKVNYHITGRKCNYGSKGKGK